jgi:hypothetical protein
MSSSLARRLVAEGVGTFFLLAAIVGSGTHRALGCRRRLSRHSREAAAADLATPSLDTPGRLIQPDPRVRPVDVFKPFATFVLAIVMLAASPHGAAIGAIFGPLQTCCRSTASS